MTGEHRFKRTPAITLVLIATLSVAACGDDDRSEQQVYRSRADCLRDWQREDRCERVSGGTYPVGYYYGPRYYGSGGTVYYYQRGGTAVALPPDAPFARNYARTGSFSSSRTAGITRGGFGGSALGRAGG